MTDTCRKILVDLNKMVDFSEPWGKCECFADPSGMDDIGRRVTAILSNAHSDPALAVDVTELIAELSEGSSRESHYYSNLKMTEAADVLTAQSAALAAARAENERLREALTELVRAVETTVNEKGGGGFILARLSDARAALATEGG